RGARGRLWRQPDRDRLQRPLSARHHGAASGQRGGIQARRRRLADAAGRCRGRLGALCADAHAGVMAQSRPEPNILAFPAASRVSPSGGVAEAGALQLGALLAGPYVARLMVSDFRCYERGALETDPRPVVLTGPNGAGKTNLLEALSFL